MEIIMISDCKLKVMLGEEDLKQFEIKADQLDYSSTETTRMFWDILNRAKHETGFDTDGQRVLVQLYPSKQGGCEMLVTKIGLLYSENEEESPKYNCGEKDNQKASRTKKEKRHMTDYSAFSFDTVTSMINVCKRLCALGHIGESSSYICDNGKKYLLLSDIYDDEYRPINEFSFILEYASPEDTKKLGYFISEHGKLIFENDAVSKLGKL
jgi:negative regulator of genetic competence, sporulation and motility